MTEATPLASEQITMPAGWKLVPEKLTAEMCFAYDDCPYEGAEDKWRSLLSASPAPSGQGVSGEGWDHRYRPLAFGEIIKASDECRRDDGAWVTGICVGQPAPDPAYTSHRMYRRLKAAPAPSCAPGEVDYRLKLAMALFEARYGMRLMAWSDETRDYWLAQADAALSPQGLDAKEGEQVVCATCHSGRECDCGQRLDAATVERFREAIVTIIGRCEALEDEAADELAKEQPEHASGFYRGQKTIAKSLRNHLADLARPITLATEPHQHGGKGA